MAERPIFPQGEDYSFSLTQYMVVLDKPIGLTLAPDPTTGQVYVQQIQEGMSAAESRLVLVGDRLLSCSAVFGDEMWHASDLQRTRWAINNRPGKVKLVFERSTVGPVPPWYFKGRQGIATWEVPELQLPIQFVTPVGGELTESVQGIGRVMMVSFNRCINPTTPDPSRRPVLRPGLVARRARAEALLQHMADAAAAPDVDITSPASRLLAGRDGARFQVGVSGTPVQPGGTTNVLPFRRQGSGSSTPSSGSSSGSSGPPAGSSSSNSTGPLGGNNSNSGVGSTPSNNTNNTQSNSSSNSNSTSSGAAAAAVMGAPVSAAAGDVSSSSSLWQGSSSSSSSSNPAAAAAAAAAWGGGSATPSAGMTPVREKKVIQVLPWLLISNGKLTTNDLTRLATNRALGCLLELRLGVNSEGLLCPGNSQPPPFSLPAAPVPPTLSPSDTPAPAPATPPPLPAAQQQQQEEEEQQQQSVPDDAGAVAAGLVGIAGPDTGFASAAATAAAVAAAVATAPEPPDLAGAAAGSSSSSSGSSIEQQQQGGSQKPSGPAEPSPRTLQAHALLHCVADLHRLSVRRCWTPRAGIGWYRSNNPSNSAGISSPSLQGSAASYSLQGLGHSSSSSGQLQQQQQQVQQPSSQLLLNCEEGSWGLVGLMLVTWLHWHCGVEQADAVENVSKALGVTLDVAVLDEVRRLLVVRAKERFSRIMLKWPYGGLSAEVSGELVGGWTERVAMRRCMKPEGCLGASKGNFYLELKGLHPGKYNYKYIIDNNWDIDPLATKTLDTQGNWNNVLEVKPPPSIESPEEQAHFAALQALCMAFDRKLKPVSRAPSGLP